MFLSILRTISALKGETSPFSERAAVKIKIRRDGAQRTQRQFGTGPPARCRYEFMDYEDVVMPRRVKYRRFSRLH